MNRLRREADLVLAALQFLTRLPVSGPADYAADTPTRATRWFPLAGWLVGALSAAIWLGAGQLWGAPVAAVAAVAASALATGALHEDGLADTADALGGGATPERRLAIMKDSRIGSYGVMALVGVLALRVGALARLSPFGGAGALVAAHGMARALAVVAMRLTPYAGDPRLAKGRDGALRPSLGEAAFAAALGAVGVALAEPWRAAILGVALALAAALALLGVARALVGGHTGDVLGAVEQLAEAGLLLGASACI